MNSKLGYEIIFGEKTSEIERFSVPSDLDLIAGMIAAGVGIMEKLNYNHAPREYYLITTADISQYRVEREITETDLSSHMKGRLQPNQRGIWMASAQRFQYDLYAFTDDAFFQGVISICNYFGVDFRDYIYGTIFDDNGKQYALEGYTMTDYQIAIVVTDSDDEIPDFYSTGEEKEREGDENIITPLKLGGFPEDNDL